MNKQQLNLFEEDAKEIEELSQIDTSSMANLGNCVEQLLKLKKEVSEIESNLKEKKKQVYTLESVTLPDLMLQLNCSKHETVSGEVIKLQDVIRASIPSLAGIAKAKGEAKDEMISRRIQALDWLTLKGLDGIVKNEVSVNVGKSIELKTQVLDALKNVGVDAEVESNVHASTLASTLKDLLKNNEEVPGELFNLYNGKIVKVTKK